MIQDLVTKQTVNEIHNSLHNYRRAADIGSISLIYGVLKGRNKKIGLKRGRPFICMTNSIVCSTVYGLLQSLVYGLSTNFIKTARYKSPSE